MCVGEHFEDDTLLRMTLLICYLIATPAVAGTKPPEPVLGPIHVIDGETVRLASDEIVRIYNIEAPETHKPHCPAEKWYGESSSSYLATLLSAGGVMISRCEPATGRCQDRYGRTLATLSTRNVNDVGDALIGMGLAMPGKSERKAKDLWIEFWCKGPIE